MQHAMLGITGSRSGSEVQSKISFLLESAVIVLFYLIVCIHAIFKKTTCHVSENNLAWLSGASQISRVGAVLDVLGQIWEFP